MADAPEPYAALADVLRNLATLVHGNRRRLQLSQRAAARQIGCSYRTVSRIEDGELPTGTVLLAVLAWLGADR